VENRVLPAGPTIVDTLANAAFYYGALRVLAQEERPVWTKMSFAAARGQLRPGRPGRHRRQAVLAGAWRDPGSRAGPAAPAAGRA
jgi:hypothetical protein